jgi:DNA-binding SARP family transcriptional activator
MGKKTGALLTLLALTPGQQRSREELIDLLWPDADFEDARNCFRQIIHRLRRVLEPEAR